MNKALISGLLAALIAKGFCGNGDDMLVTQWTKNNIAWTNCILGTTCSVQMASAVPGGAWTNLVSSVVVTSALMTVDVPAVPGDAVFLRVVRPFDPFLGLVAWYQFEGDARDSSVWLKEGCDRLV